MRPFGSDGQDAIGAHADATGDVEGAEGRRTEGGGTEEPLRGWGTKGVIISI